VTLFTPGRPRANLGLLRGNLFEVWYLTAENSNSMLRICLMTLASRSSPMLKIAKVCCELRFDREPSLL
jgi:hypothetical protein